MSMVIITDKNTTVEYGNYNYKNNSEYGNYNWYSFVRKQMYGNYNWSENKWVW